MDTFLCKGLSIGPYGSGTRIPVGPSLQALTIDFGPDERKPVLAVALKKSCPSGRHPSLFILPGPKPAGP